MRNGLDLQRMSWEVERDRERERVRGVKKERKSKLASERANEREREEEEACCERSSRPIFQHVLAVLLVGGAQDRKVRASTEAE